ncbi:MAG: proline--tRNA ligase [Bacillota bacterium]
MRMSDLYMPTLKEDPTDSDVVSDKLLRRAGMVRKLVSGIYSYMPLGNRVLQKVENIVREEQDKAGFQEVLMSAVQPRELWDATGRWEDFGPEMFKLNDRKGRQFCLGPTHEEYFTDFVKNELNSYKQLPLIIYQIQNKYRDERRPRAGLIRGREFLMKDAYNFDKNEEGMKKSYERVWKSYEKTFDRLGFEYKIVQGDSGNMGGNVSHEFIALTSGGEAKIAYCDDCDFAQTDEIAKSVTNEYKEDDDILKLEKVLTPDVKTIEQLKEYFDLPKKKFVKTLLYKLEGRDEVIAVVIPGDRELNTVKLSKYLNIHPEKIVMLEEHEIKDLAGSILGFVGPIGLKDDVRIIVDSRIKEMRNFIIGANEKDYHFKNANFPKDLEHEEVKDLLNARQGDICPDCGSKIKIDVGIEIGNIFQFGTKYSKGLDATFLDENGKEQYFWMGSHGIGVSRIIAALIEQNHDENGIIWPINTAPYQVEVNVLHGKDDEKVEFGEKIYNSLKEKGIEVLFDDRKERIGVKFNEMDLLGIPLRIVVGRRADEGIVEFSTRKDMEVEEINYEKAIQRVVEKVNAAL